MTTVHGPTRLFVMYTFLAILVGAVSSCGGRNSGTGDSENGVTTANPYALPDTLRAVTLYSPMSYFHYRDEVMGYDYNLLTDFVQSHGLVLDLKVAPSLNKAIQMLDSGLVDLIAYEVPVTAEYKQHATPCGPEWISSQVLVQRTDSDSPVRDVTDLIGKEVWVEPDSKYQHRLENLNDELGGGIIIKTINRDTLITEDAIEMVSRGEIDLTVVGSDIARVNKTYYNDIDVSVEVSFGQRSRWAVSVNRPWLGDSITTWFNSNVTRTRNDALLKKYFQIAKQLPVNVEETIDFSDGIISQYDDLFKKYAAEIGWDWRLLAAQGWVESQFRNEVVSWAGARGIMQIMPRTARSFGTDPEDLTDPETSIRIAAELIKSLDEVLVKAIPDKTERRKFVTAAYNSGQAHILDAIALAKKYDYDPQIWEGNVSEALLMKTKPEYYRDPVVKYGYFRGQQTTSYVEKVFDFYNRAKKAIKE
ncbi:MAG: transglycosylase SLT domain-containing protein [Bacteroidales bacterium]|nr:transglycosylase SLT domain-containing protein [Bacteroidales bacterium]